MSTYTVIIDGHPIELLADHDNHARHLAGQLVHHRAPQASWSLVRDRDGETIGHGTIENYRAHGWKAAADSPLRGPF